MKNKICLAATYLIILFSYVDLHAFMVDVHEKITVTAINYSQSKFNESLNGVGITNGINEDVSGKKIREWVEYGSKQEDEPLVEFRYLNHFYNPLDHTGYGLFESFYWSEDDGNMWSWKTARGQYLVGLTASTDSDRKRALGFSFRALGQVMHLVQDLASPAHVRNDGYWEEFGV